MIQMTSLMFCPVLGIIFIPLMPWLMIRNVPSKSFLTINLLDMIAWCPSISSIHQIVCMSWWQLFYSQVKSSQKVLLQQNHKHTWNNTETETHWVHLIMQSWPQLHWLVWVQALRRNGRGSSATAASSCTKGYHAENLQCNQQRQCRHYYDPSAPVNKNDAKHHIVEIP